MLERADRLDAGQMPGSFEQAREECLVIAIEDVDARAQNAAGIEAAIDVFQLDQASAA